MSQWVTDYSLWPIACSAPIGCTWHNLLWLFGGVEIVGNANSRIDTVDTFACADVSVQSIVLQSSDVVGSVVRGCRAALPDLFQFARHRYRLANSDLDRKENIMSVVSLIPGVNITKTFTSCSYCDESYAWAEPWTFWRPALMKALLVHGSHFGPVRFLPTLMARSPG